MSVRLSIVVPVVDDDPRLAAVLRDVAPRSSDDVEVFALPIVTFTALADLCIDAGVQTFTSNATPGGGTISGSGVTDNGNGTYDFDPAAAFSLAFFVRHISYFQ